MTILYMILLSVIQGIFEFLPVSSFGHLALVQQLLGIEQGPGVLFEVMLHFGTLAAVILTFQKDIRHIVLDTLEIIMDIIGNISLYFKNKRSSEQYHYAKIINTAYRKFTVMIWVSMIPTALLGYFARRLVELSLTSKLISSAGILVTGIILLVIDLSQAGGTKSARDMNTTNAMWIGICQGLSVFPGISRAGLTISAGLMSGFSRTFAVKYSYILSIPAIIGAMILEVGEFTSSDMTIGLGFMYFFGMILAGITGYFTIRLFLKLVHKGKFRYFAIYCFLIGLVSLILNYL